MSVSLALFAVALAFSGQQQSEGMDWQAQTAAASVPDPSRPNAQPNLGYTGIWRSIYGEQDQDDKAQRNRFPASATQPGLLTAPGVANQRKPRIRAARNVGIAQGALNLPAFEVSRESLDESVAEFVWDHQVEQADELWARQTLSTGPTTQRDYSSRAPQEQQQAWTEDAPKSNNYLLTIGIAAIAIVLLVVIVFMPK